MTTRRRVLKTAGGALAGGALAACGRQGRETAAEPAREATGEAAPPEDAGITARSVAEAEKIAGVSYTPAERAMMLPNLEERLEATARLRAQGFPNAAPPAHVFNPVPPGRAPAPQTDRYRPLARPRPPAPSDEAAIAYASVADLGHWLRTGEISSVALTELYLERIARHGEALACFVTVTPDIARREAAAADADLAAGRDRGPLHGIPYGMKDIVDTAGVLTSWGATPYRTRTPEADATIVTALREAGAVLLGKTTCGAIAYGDIWFGGVTRNPWNPEEGSSGSSAGSASATAAGLCGFSIGSETLGSIISPSERCGTAGLRPTFGRVSRAGVMALCWSLDKMGPICRYTEDNAAVLSVLNGHDPADPASAAVGFDYDGEADLAGLRVGYVPAWFEEGDEVDRAALEAMRGLGMNLREITWPDLDIDALSDIVDVEAAAAFEELTLTDRDEEMVWRDARAWPNTWRAARFVSAVDYVQMDRLRRRLMEALAEVFDGVDVMIGPNFAEKVLLATNCTGHPQMAVRAGFAMTPTRGLWGERKSEEPVFETPRAVSLWSGLFREGPMVALGARLETALGVADRRPPGFAA